MSSVPKEILVDLDISSVPWLNHDGRVRDSPIAWMDIYVSSYYHVFLRGSDSHMILHGRDNLSLSQLEKAANYWF